MRSLLFVLGLLSIWSCNEKSKKGSHIAQKIDTVLFSNPTTIEFVDTNLNLGEVKGNEKTRIVYHYKNTGDKPLMLFNVRPGCGCTIADYNSKPIRAGENDSIVAFFDSKNKEGPYLKSIMVNSNTKPELHRLTFKVDVVN